MVSTEQKERHNESTAAKERVFAINQGLSGADLHRGMVEPAPGQSTPFRISPEPFFIDEELYRRIEALGPHLLAFYQAANRLYLHSVRGSQPDWVRSYLEAGKSETVIDYQRMRRFRGDVPAIIRPDIVPTDDGLIISELDSVPGGFGLLAALSEQYAELGYELVGGADGIPKGLWEAATDGVESDDPIMAVTVSDESNDYRGEMRWIAEKLRQMGHKAYEVHPKQIRFEEEGLFIEDEEATRRRVDVLYRFFELFDLKNIPKIDLILYAIRKSLVKATPPLKSNLEEKLLFALLHHPALAPFWRQHLGKETYALCREVFPQSWVVDPTPMPPHAAVPGLEIGGLPVQDWRQLKEASQRERELVLKPSGFSPNAWGSRGVLIGHDLPAEEWGEGIERALADFPQTPHVLQVFHKGRKFRVRYFDFVGERLVSMQSRVRLCPYYFVIGDEVKLGGILATAVPLDKKVIHGMSEAVMAPVAVKAD